MRMYTLILLLCFGLLIPHQGKADVDAIYFQMNLNGEVVDIGSAGTDSSDFSDLLEDIQTDDVAEQEGVDESEPESTRSVPVRSVDDSASEICSFNNSGETEGNCECPSDGNNVVQLVQANATTSGTPIYVCCNLTTHKIYRDGFYSKNFMPWCGCLNSSYRAPFVSSDQLCCKDGKHWYNTISDNGEPTGVADSKCGCPDDSTEVTYESVQHCCRGLMDLATKDGGPNNPEVCGCVAGDETYCNKTRCENTAGHTWCAIGDSDGWCTAEASCQADCATKGGVWCAKNNQCMSGECESGKTWNESDCACQNVCSAAYPEVCDSEETCTSHNGHWCYVEGGTEDDPIHVCQKTTCCQEGYQQGADGKCYPCPTAEGAMSFENGQYLCCKKDGSGQAYMMYESSGHWYAEAACGCPMGGEKKNGICCQNGYAYNGTSYSSTGHFNQCGCPDDGEFKEKKGICCKDGHPFGTGGYSESEDIALCGCGSKVLDPSANTCVTCLEDTDCEDNKRCLVDVTNSSKNKCVACLSYTDCGEQQICNTEHECASCQAGTSYFNGQCYECSTSAHCPENKPYCDADTHTCVICQPDATQDQTPDSGCEAATPYCVQTNKGRQCSECWINQNCPADKPICDVTNGLCVARDCTADWECGGNTPKCNRKTGKCVAAASCVRDSCECSGDNAVWNIYEKRCVNCYDSISSNWTDLGCPDDEPSASNVATYSTRGFLNADKRNRICLVNRLYPDGKCVECLMDSHCPVGQGCINYMCECDEGKAYDSTLKQCVECNANYGVSDGTIMCPRTKPVCNLQNHMCETCPDMSAYSTVSHQCVTCLESQCLDTTETTSETLACVNLSDYDDVARNSDGTCKKKNLTAKYEISGCICTPARTTCIDQIGYNLPWRGGWDNAGRDIKDFELDSRNLRLKYEHSVTIETDSADDCTYGSNLTGKLTAVDADSEAKTCQYYIDLGAGGAWQMDSKFKATSTVQPGVYQGIHLKIKDIWESAVGLRNGSGSIKFND